MATSMSRASGAPSAAAASAAADTSSARASGATPRATILCVFGSLSPLLFLRARVTRLKKDLV